VIDELYPPVLRTLLSASRTTAFGASRLWRRHDQLHLPMDDDFRALFEKFRDIRANSSNLRWWVDKADPVGSLLTSGEAMIAATEELLLSISNVLTQPAVPSELSSVVRFTPEEELEKLAVVREQVSRLTPVHQRVQLRLGLSASEYSCVDPQREKAMLMVDRLNREFLAPLTAARDAFFDEATPLTLRSFIAVAEQLAEQEHPLASKADGKTVVRDLRHDAAAVELDAKLTADELMFELLSRR